MTYPAASVVFYAAVFEFVTFDVVPTDGAYAAIFHFKDVPYSQQAANVGYPSRYFIPNSGSVPIFMILNLVLQLIFFALINILKSGKVFRFAQFKHNSFLWAGFNDFINEIYLTQSFAICINTSSLGFVSLAVGFNNSFMSAMALVVAILPIYVAAQVYIE